MSAGIGATANEPIPLTSDHHRFLSLRQLNAIAISLVLAFSGMVFATDIAIALLSFPYIIFLSRFAFPSHPHPEPPVFGPANRLLSVHVTVGAILGLLLPIAYIFEGIMEGDKEGIKAAAPHVFLLASQVLLEGMTFARRLSLPVRAFVPVSYNGMRMLRLVEWVVAEMRKEEGMGGGGRRWALRVLAGRGLAVANCVFWGFNLFGFLLPVYLPRALKRHYDAGRYKEK